MSNIQIKRSNSATAMPALIAGELAYLSTSTATAIKDRLYIGHPDGSSGNLEVGGVYYTDLINAATDSNTASTLVKRSASGGASLDAAGDHTGTFVGGITGSTFAGTTVQGSVITATTNFAGDLTGDVTGNASTATLLANSRTIAGKAFNGSASITLDTTNVTEDAAATLSSGTMYFTQARARAAISAGGDLSYNALTGVVSFSASASPVVSVNGATGSVSLDTDDVSEGSTNEYFTTARVDAHLSGTSGVTYNAGTISIGTSAITSTMLAGSIVNAKLANDNLTIGSTNIALGATETALAGLTQLTVDNIDLNGNAITTTSGDLTLNPAGDITVSNNRITNLGTPTAATDAATKGYVDAVAEGLHVHAAVHAYQATNLGAAYSNGTAGVGATLTFTGSMPQFDGVTLSVGERVLVAGMSSAAENGIYEKTATLVLTRATDFDTPTEMAGGDFVFVDSGSTYANTGWVLDAPVTTVGSVGVSFIQFSGAGTFTAGTGMDLTGTSFSVTGSGGIASTATGVELAAGVAGAGLTLTSGVLDVVGVSGRTTITANAVDISATYAGQTSIDTVGTITTGTWNGTGIDVANGGTGLSTVTANGLMYGNGTGAVAVTAAGAHGAIMTSVSGTPTWLTTIDGGSF